MKRSSKTALFPRAFFSGWVSLGLFSSESPFSWLIAVLFAWYSILNFQTMIRLWLKHNP